MPGDPGDDRLLDGTRPRLIRAMNMPVSTAMIAISRPLPTLPVQPRISMPLPDLQRAQAQGRGRSEERRDDGQDVDQVSASTVRGGGET